MYMIVYVAEYILYIYNGIIMISKKSRERSR